VECWGQSKKGNKRGTGGKRRKEENRQKASSPFPCGLGFLWIKNDPGEKAFKRCWGEQAALSEERSFETRSWGWTGGGAASRKNG